MKIVILDGYTENPGDLSWSGFEAIGELTVYDRTPAELIADRIGDAEIILTNKTPITGETIASATSLRYIGVLATGYNVVDITAARDNGIVVSNIPTYGTNTVAQYTIALLLELCLHVGAHSSAVMAGEWSRCSDFCFWKHPMIELAGKTFGIVGFGRIGRRTAEIALAFGMQVIACDSSLSTSPSDSVELVTMDELLTRSDVISLHCPLLPDTERLIQKASISKMKDGVMILNSSRGPLIDEGDLRDALVSGKVGGAAVDVVSTEPILPNNPLLSAPNCIITPHVAWAAKESRARLMDIAVQNLQSFLCGAPDNVVNT